MTACATSSSSQSCSTHPRVSTSDLRTSCGGGARHGVGRRGGAGGAARGAARLRILRLQGGFRAEFLHGPLGQLLAELLVLLLELLALLHELLPRDRPRLELRRLQLLLQPLRLALGRLELRARALRERGRATRGRADGRGGPRAAAERTSPRSRTISALIAGSISSSVTCLRTGAFALRSAAASSWSARVSRSFTASRKTSLPSFRRCCASCSCSSRSDLRSSSTSCRRSIAAVAIARCVCREVPRGSLALPRGRSHCGGTS